MYIYPCIGRLHVVISRLSPNNLYFKNTSVYEFLATSLFTAKSIVY